MFDNLQECRTKRGLLKSSLKTRMRLQKRFILLLEVKLWVIIVKNAKNGYVVIGISAGMHTMVWKCQINYQKDFKLIVLALFAHNFPHVLRNCVCSTQCWQLFW